MDDFIRDLEEEEKKTKPIPIITDKSLYPFKSISQTLIKKVVSPKEDDELGLNFNLRKERCPLQTFYIDIAKIVPSEPTESMLKGLYGETKLLGSSARGRAYHDAPKKKRGLGIPIDYERIDRQMENAKKVMFDNFVNISPINTQVPLSVYHPVHDIIVTMEMDIFPTTILKDGDIKLSIVDLKITKDINSTFSEFCWGDPDNMDHIQADLYTYFCNYVYSNDKAIKKTRELNPSYNYDYIFNDNIVRYVREYGLLFYYFVFGYTESIDKGIILERQYKILERVRTQEKEYKMIERLSYAIEILKEDERNGWKPEPSTECCKKCPLKNKVCDKFKEIDKI